MAGGEVGPGGVPGQAGVLEGSNPSKYNPADPIVLFIIQSAIIIIACRLLHWPLSKFRQPKVIAEVIGGIVLGPTVLGNIPGYMDTIFPKESMPNLTLAANLGLVLFLFLVGLEVDMRILFSNWKTAASVGALGMAFPFALGAAIAYGLYHEFRGDPGVEDISFGVYMLFIGVAMAITAFPVLARILTELKLLQTNVGTIVLSAGVANDVVGWILLALTVALVNAGTGLTALYVLLVCIAYVLFLIYAVRPAFLWILRRDGSLENGPSQSMVGLTLLMVLASAFFTNIIGVHAIFGGFLIGLICPHEGGFAVQLTEKIEDLVTVLFLPLYFALSGLKTDIGLLNSGIVWGYVAAVLAVAFFGKIVGGTLAARWTGMVWRESFTIGVLMSCKGLVELIVLNIGLQAGILSTRVFTIFVVMALVTTFATTPLVLWLYPLDYQRKIEAWKRGEIDWDGNPLRRNDDDVTMEALQREKNQTMRISKITVLLRLENLPSIFSFVDLLGSKPIPAAKVHKSKKLPATILEEGELSGASDNEKEKIEEAKPIGPPVKPLEVHGERLVELTQRTSAVMQVSEVDELQQKDPVVNVFRTFGSFHNIAVSAGLSIAPSESFAEVLTNRAVDQSSDLLLIPWSETGAVTESEDPTQYTSTNRFMSEQHNQFISRVLAQSSASCSTAIMVNRGFGSMFDRGLSRANSFRSLRERKEINIISPISDPSHHIFFPFFGGSDDRVALRFVLQLAANTNVTATIVQVIYAPDENADPNLQLPPIAIRRDVPRNLSHSQVPTLSNSDVPTAAASTTSLVPVDADSIFFSSIRDSCTPEVLTRVLFETVRTPQPLQYVVTKAREEVGQTPRNAGDLVILGRGRRDNRPHIRSELVQVLASLGVPSGTGMETRRCLGDVAEAVVVASVKASVLVFQAGGKVLRMEHEARLEAKEATIKEE
ncbi:Sodium/hydrogen exchanger family-domain-containing protein [Pyronema omphalodes]|nr:Sodium/hydrogen exchanger family-domain-containing protein [Pyronema omphalodes]